MVFHNLRLAALAAIITTVSVLPFGQEPRRDFRATDFAHLRWLEGTWVGSMPNGGKFYERYHFLNDSTIEMQSFSDASLRTVSEKSTIALRAGRIVNEGAKNHRWEAAKVTSRVAQFMPVRGVTNAFQLSVMSRNRWTATIIPASGKRTVYEMRAK